MCGITGWLATRAEPTAVQRAVEALHHRGPDDSGIWSGEGVVLGFARLAILDLSAAGHQPMSTGDGRFTLVFNGEIYNFAELRGELEAQGESFKSHSDSEVLLRLLSRRGLEGCLERLRGMFAFAAWDNVERRLLIARDRLGVKPLVFAQTNEGFCFASEIGALFALMPGLSREADPVALDHYLTLNYIPAPLSGFRAIRKLPPAHAMIVKEGRVERQFRYWQPDFSRPAALSFGEACEALREQVLDATRLRLVSDVPLGAFLSGGIDSSITVAAMARTGGAPPETFSIGFDEDRFNELPQAREVATFLGTRHHEMVVRADAVKVLPRLIEHVGEPMADNSLLPTYYVSHFARQYVTVALSGDGGDESFAGYRRFFHALRAERMAGMGLLPAWRTARRLGIAAEGWLNPRRRGRRYPATRADEMLEHEGLARYRHLIALFPDADKERLMTPALRTAAGSDATLAYLSGAFGPASADALNRYLALELGTYLPEDILFKVDAASMAVSLECRSPFLDHRLVEFAARLPGRYKMGFPGRHKHILKAAFVEWLPRGFLDRPKKGFSVPVAAWLRGSLAGQLRESLLGRGTLDAWIRRDTAARLVEEHLDGRRDHGQQLWSLLVLGIWVERFAVTA